MEENHPFQFIAAMDGNESPIPTTASFLETSSKVPDGSLMVWKSATPSHCTPIELVRGSTRITKGVPPK